jgi:multiple sugar transport system substrate-binding protein
MTRLPGRGPLPAVVRGARLPGISWPRLRRAWLPALAVLLPLAAACAGPARSESVTLRFWALGREGEVVQELMPEFERSHPGIRVLVQQIPIIAAHEKLLTAFVGRTTPDLAQIGNTWIPELATIGALSPLDDRLGRSRALAPDQFFAGVWDTNVIGGALYGVPWYVDTRLLFYRTDLLAAAGYPAPPRSWSGWRHALERIQRGAPPGRHAVLLPIDEPEQPIILGLQLGAPLLKDGRRGDFEEPRFAAAFDFYTGLYRDGLAPIAGNAEIGNVHQQFADGDFVFYPTGPWNLGEFRRRLPPALAERWATTAWPAPDGAEPPGVSLAGGSSLSIFRAARHPAAAWQLVEYLSQPAQQLRFYRLCGDLPAHRDAWEDPALATDPRARAFREQLQHVRAAPKIPEWEQIAKQVAYHAEVVVRRRLPPAGARAELAALDRDVDRILEKRRWMLSRTHGGRGAPATPPLPAPATPLAPAVPPAAPAPPTPPTPPNGARR